MSQTPCVSVVAATLLAIMMVMGLAVYLQASELSSPDMLEIDYRGPETHPSWPPPEFHPIYPKSQSSRSKSDAGRKVQYVCDRNNTPWIKLSSYQNHVRVIGRWQGDKGMRHGMFVETDREPRRKELQLRSFLPYSQKICWKKFLSSFL